MLVVLIPKPVLNPKGQGFEWQNGLMYKISWARLVNSYYHISTSNVLLEIRYKIFDYLFILYKHRMTFSLYKFCVLVFN